MKRLILLVVFLVSFVLVFRSYIYSSKKIGIVDMQKTIAQSHIDANVPPPQDVDRLLKLALEKEFGGHFKEKPSIQYEFLRKVPTQVGVGLPKFYLWVRFYQKGKLVEQGAVRVAARDQKAFDVLQFLSVEDIRRYPEKVDLVFPQALVQEIKQRAL